ncbi:frataxin [Necator americanus]|uniref:ferroxidase n=1 Tax=Necator americanus TaxID=51031 RepID=W2SFP9_NECAM|nr:frataxin [Necator americanus]ETN68343.1 frataxin [Necator americanus]
MLPPHHRKKWFPGGMLITRLCRSAVRKDFGRALCSTVSQNEYEKAAEESLERLSEYLDTLPERFNVSSEFDVTHAMGVLTVVISKEIGTYVINKQSPNRQLWLSSPVSGPKRYDLINHRWIYSHDNEALDSLLTKEFRKIFATEDIDFRENI